MKILFLTSQHNELSQRAYTELTERGHAVEVQQATSENAVKAAAARFQPQLIVDSFLKVAIPENIRQQHAILSIRPLSTSDRGPSSQKGSIAESWQNWRIALLEGAEEAELFSILTSGSLKFRPDHNQNFYRHHAAGAIVQEIIVAIEKIESERDQQESFYAQQANLKGRMQSLVH